jgi:anaerobic ribonucleoside-triphosphate reductase
MLKQKALSTKLIFICLRHQEKNMFTTSMHTDKQLATHNSELKKINSMHDNVDKL